MSENKESEKETTEQEEIEKIKQRIRETKAETLRIEKQIETLHLKIDEADRRLKEIKESE